MLRNKENYFYVKYCTINDISFIYSTSWDPTSDSTGVLRVEPPQRNDTFLVNHSTSST